MGQQADAMMHPGDIMRRIRDLEQQVKALQTARRLESASIGAGGLRVRGGRIEILDVDGDVQMTLATDGLTLAGLLEVMGGISVEGDVEVSGGGSIQILDGDGNVQMTLATDGLTLNGLLEVVGGISVSGDIDVKDGGSIQILDGGGDVQLTLATDGLTLTGLLTAMAGLVKWEDDAGRMRVAIGQQGTTAWPAAESVRIIYQDTAGAQRVIVGEILKASDGSLAGHGLLVQDGSGGDQLVARDGRAKIAVPGGGFLALDGDSDDEMDLYDAAGNFRATVGPVTWGGSPDGYGIYIQKANGDDTFFASENHMYVVVGGGTNEGEVTAGAADSAGVGFRVLRIPN